MASRVCGIQNLLRVMEFLTSACVCMYCESNFCAREFLMHVRGGYTRLHLRCTLRHQIDKWPQGHVLFVGLIFVHSAALVRDSPVITWLLHDFPVLLIEQSFRFLALPFHITAYHQQLWSVGWVRAVVPHFVNLKFLDTDSSWAWCMTRDHLPSASRNVWIRLTRCLCTFL